MSTEYEQLPSGIILATAIDEPPQPKPAPLAHSKEYNRLHAVCPKCMEWGCERTTMGCGGTEDTNRARCYCGWVDIVHDLVPRPGAKEERGGGIDLSLPPLTAEERAEMERDATSYSVVKGLMRCYAAKGTKQ